MKNLIMAHPAKGWLFGIILIICPCSVSATAAILPEISLLPEISVQKARIYLADMLAAGSRSVVSLPEQLNTTVLAFSPAPGKTRVFESREVYQRLAEIGITPDRYTIRIPDQIRVERQAQTLSPADIENKVKSEFLPTLPWKDVQLLEIGIPESVVLPLGKLELAFQYPPRTDLVRPFYLNINFRVNGETVRRAYLRTMLTISGNVAVAERELGAAETVTASDVRWERRALPSTLRQPVSAEEFFQNRKTRSAIAPEQIMTEDMFVVVPVIKRGDLIVLLYRDDRIQISTQGQSLGSGSRGERIRVMNLASRKELVAEIVNEKTVKVAF